MQWFCVWQEWEWGETICYCILGSKISCAGFILIIITFSFGIWLHRASFCNLGTIQMCRLQHSESLFNMPIVNSRTWILEGTQVESKLNAGRAALQAVCYQVTWGIFPRSRACGLLTYHHCTSLELCSCAGWYLLETSFY